MSKIFEMGSGARYEIKEDGLYSLNYAEKGMFGCSMNVIIPKHLADIILANYKAEQAFKNRGKEEDKVFSSPKEKPKKESPKTTGDGIKLGKYLSSKVV